jgi:predicted SnoaL-like aldol condensation-catalyzing enzyme
MSEHNKSLVRRFYEEVENQGKLDVVDQLFAADFRDVYNTASPFPVVGIEGVKKLAVGLHEALNLHIEIEDLTAEGDRVVAQISCDVTHKNPFMGKAPTGKQHVMKGVEIFRVVGGKLAERWVFIDMVPFMKDLGVLPK